MTGFEALATGIPAKELGLTAPNVRESGAKGAVEQQGGRGRPTNCRRT